MSKITNEQLNAVWNTTRKTTVEEAQVQLL